MRFNKIIIFILFFTFLVLINSFVIYYLNQEKYIYFWDYAVYWRKFIYAHDLLKGNLNTALGIVLNSIKNEVYNLLPVFILAPFSNFFTISRLGYVLSIVNIFYIPAGLILANFFKTIAKSISKKEISIILSLILFTLLFFPPLIIPILRGYLDIVGLIIIGLVLLVVFNKPIEKQRLFLLLALGISLAVLVILRRWYAYWVVSFFIAYICAKVFFLKRNLSSYKTKLPPILFKIIFVVFIAFGFFYTIAYPLSNQILHTDFVSLNTAYRTKESLKQIIDQFGQLIKYINFLNFSLFIIGIYAAIKNKKLRLFSSFMILQFFITFFLFARTQDFNPHHYYLIIPNILYFIIVGLTNIYYKFNNLKYLLVALYSFFTVLNFIYVLLPSPVSRLPFFFSSSITHYYPLRRNDIKELDNLISTLNQFTAQKKDLIYVLSSSHTFNDDILRNLCLIRNYKICDNILPTYHVDKRDGIPRHFFLANYVVVADPIQYHLKSSEQKVIGYFADILLNNKDFAKYYKKIDVLFKLDGNIKLFIYKKKL